MMAYPHNYNMTRTEKILVGILIFGSMTLYFLVMRCLQMSVRING